MALTAYRKHKIYLAAAMGYGLGSDDSEETLFYNKIKEDMKEDRNKNNLGIGLED